ncbi:DUF4349 domain-containing protein [Pontibacter sp. HSC-36F09]|uniref:DUF4349 domain-containing protein n=1 Tax=Pontibacter sp. HSC-36F09 TaxID=2910966 RepID=UPI00209E67C3|nr:DUF4349 domain-containing protein [Pontibacter sp. HSC-36F09]MCP2042140.1 hypothetical protein [Pontibacter sp. HSC-36F09]
MLRQLFSKTGLYLAFCRLQKQAASRAKSGRPAIAGMVLLTLLFSIAGCQSQNEETEYDVAESVMMAPPPPEVPPMELQRKLIKEGQVEYETDQIEQTRQQVFAVVEKHKGYIASDNEFKSPGRTSNTLVIRVPADNFDNLLREATAGVKKFDAREVNVKDVTEEFLDIQARLKTKKELEARFLELLKKANTVTEVLEIEKQIAALRSDIESIEGRLKYLENQVFLSTLTMTFYESAPVYTEFSKEFKAGFRNGWDHLIWFFVFLTNIWPFLLLGLLLLFGLNVYRKRYKK